MALVFVDLLEIAPPLLLKRALDTLGTQGAFGIVAECAILFFVVFFFQGVGRYGWRVLLIRASHVSGRNLRQEFADRLFELPSAFYDRNRVGDLMSLSNGDVEGVRQFLGPGLLTFADALFYLCTVPVAMFLLSPHLTWIVLLPLPIIPLIVVAFERRIHARYKASANHYSTLSSMAQESLNGIRLVKAFAKEERQTERFRLLGESYIQLNLRLSRVQSSFGPILDFFTSLGLVVLVWFGGREVIGGAITIGTLVAFQRFVQKMVWPMVAFGFSLSLYQRASASGERLTDVIDRPSEIIDGGGETRASARAARRDPRRVEFRNLTFSYPGSSERPALRNVSLRIEPGMRAALVGTVGSGKSSLLQLIPRIYAAPSGTVFVGDVPVEDWKLEELRRSIGMVTQDVFLFSDTLERNISFREPGLDAGLRTSRVHERLEQAAFSDDLVSLERGLGTLLGERGVTLSGGQRQRVSIARALFDAPPILLFDDALSAVDVKTESQLLRSLRAHAGDSTLIYSAHRLSSVKDADVIAVFDRGELVQRGTHPELVADRAGPYYRFHEQQRLEEELEASIREFEEHHR